MAHHRILYVGRMSPLAAEICHRFAAAVGHDAAVPLNILIFVPLAEHPVLKPYGTATFELQIFAKKNKNMLFLKDFTHLKHIYYYMKLHASNGFIRGEKNWHSTIQK